MQATCALNNGIYSEALASSRLLKENIPTEYLQSTPPDAEYLQYMYMTELFTHIRYGKWAEILMHEEISDSLIYAKILLEFGRGIANARLHNTIEARSSLQKIEQLMNANQRLKIRMGAFNTAYAGGEISTALLKGIIAEEENNLDEAVQWLALGVKLEDQMIYDEPKDWILPVRQFLASVYIKKGRLADAESVLRKDLIINPQNGWTLTGLGVALKGQGKIKEAKEVKKSLDLLGTGKDFNKTGPVF
jgi:tetratricopeptide (TPR) repeat protein